MTALITPGSLDVNIRHRVETRLGIRSGSKTISAPRIRSNVVKATVTKLVSESGGFNFAETASRDSGLDYDPPGAITADSLANGLSSMGLGGRAGVPFYGNQGL